MKPKPLAALLIASIIALSFATNFYQKQAKDWQRTAEYWNDRTIQLVKQVEEQDWLIGKRDRVILLQQEERRRLQRENFYHEMTIIALVKQVEGQEIQSVEPKGLAGLREFESKEHLKEWLASNDISEREYNVPSYDCEDFAIDLVLDALRDGYFMGLFGVEKRVNNVITQRHIMCFTFVGNQVYTIEPQSDKVRERGKLDK